MSAMEIDSRRRTAMAATVETGIALAVEHDRASAVKYLTEHRVPDSVIARVLCDPERRRARQ